MNLPGRSGEPFRRDIRGFLYLEILLGLSLAAFSGLAVLELQRPLESLSGRISRQTLLRSEEFRFLEALRSAVEGVEFPWWGPGPEMEIRDSMARISWRDPRGSRRVLEIHCGSGESRILLDGQPIFLGAGTGEPPARFVPLVVSGGRSPAGLTVILPDGSGESFLYASLEAVR